MFSFVYFLFPLISLHVTQPPVYQIHGGSFTQHSLILSQSDDPAVTGYYHAVTSPASVSPSPPGLQMVVCIEHELWLCVI